eukprot:6241349-Amphidinium_carterae.2
MAFEGETSDTVTFQASQLLDLKLVGRPFKLTAQIVWVDWLFEFGNYMVCVDVNYQKELRQAAMHSTPISLPGNRDGLARSYSLW